MSKYGVWIIQQHWATVDGGPDLVGTREEMETVARQFAGSLHPEEKAGMVYWARPYDGHDAADAADCERVIRREHLEEQVKAILEDDLSFYDKAHRIGRLLTLEDVEYLIDRLLPMPFQAEFVKFALEAWVPEGPRLQLGEGAPLPEACFRAIRHWAFMHGVKS